MKRVLALGVACMLVAGAVLLREVLTDDGEGGADGSGGGALVVACIPELEAACRELAGRNEVRIEEPGATVAAAAGGERIDAWITLDPWPEMAQLLEGRPLFDSTVAVAAADLVLLLRAPAVPAACAEPVSWTCAVDELGDRVALPVSASALLPLVLGHAAADFFGPGLASNDFDDPALAARLDALDQPGTDPLDDLRIGLPEPAATGTVATELSRLGGRRGDFVDSRTPTPARVAVVVAGPRAEQIAGDAELLDALDRLGWDVSPDSTTAGLPPAGVLVALTQEVTS